MPQASHTKAAKSHDDAAKAHRTAADHHAKGDAKSQVTLRYDGKRKSLINHIARVSKPGLRVYKGSAELRPIRSGLATRIISTSSGLMTDREARRRKMGGEVICEVY